MIIYNDGHTIRSIAVETALREAVNEQSNLVSVQLLHPTPISVSTIYVGTSISQAVRLGFYGSMFRMTEWRKQQRRGLCCRIAGHARIDEIPVHLLRWDLVRQSPQQLSTELNIKYIY